jgi:ABC-type oligopeptide transport system substrate-binding subunit
VAWSLRGDACDGGSELANFDPIWTSVYIARNAGLLVWDTLYGVDAKLEVQRQMIEAEEVSSDGLTWIFRLRSGLKFHDGEPVLAKDAIASINRRAARDTLGQMIKVIEQELITIDDRPHVPLDAQEAVSENATGSRQDQNAMLLRHAGSYRRDRSVQADQRIRRQQTYALHAQ